MRLVAMIEKKEEDKYEVINFLPDVKIKHISDDEFEVIEKKDYIKIPYAKGIDDLTVIVGENGVGKTRLVNDIYGRNMQKYFVYQSNLPNEKEELGDIEWLIWSYYDGYSSDDFSNANFFTGNQEVLKVNHIQIPNENTFDSRFKYASEYSSYSSQLPLSIKFSNSIELLKSVKYNLTSVTMMEQSGYDLSNDNLLYRFSLQELQRKDLFYQMDLILKNEYTLQRLSTILNLDGKVINVEDGGRFIDNLLKELELDDERLYLTGLQRIIDFKWVGNDSENLKWFVEDYLDHILSSICPIDKNEFQTGFIEMYYELHDEERSYIQFDEIRAFFEGKVEEFCAEHKILYPEELKNPDINWDIEVWKKNLKILTEKISHFPDWMFMEIVHSKEKIAEDFFRAYSKLYYSKMDNSQKLEILSMKKYGISEKIIQTIGKFFNLTEKAPDDTLLNLNYFVRFVLEKNGELHNTSDILKLKHFFKELSTLEQSGELILDIPNKGKFSLLNFILSALNLGWSGLSSGELSLLNLFGRLYAVSKEVDRQHILLLLDEVDLGLHPEWQRKWISLALPIVGEIFEGKSVQIIMTTHSPIMLSDIYSENVIMLGNDKHPNKIETFGQNIHELYRNSFFLSSTRGQYASNQINLVIGTLYKLSEENHDREQIKTEFFKGLSLPINQDEEVFKTYLKHLINAIGEKMIANKAMSMFNMVFRSDIDNQIAILEAELNELKKQREARR